MAKEKKFATGGILQGSVKLELEPHETIIPLGGTMDHLLPYQVYNDKGTLVLQAPESCRHSKRVEQDHLENGYTIRLNGRKITKKEVNKNA